MHPLITFEVHRQQQSEALGRLALLHRRERTAGSVDGARERPPESQRRRATLRVASTAALWVPTTGHMAP